MSDPIGRFCLVLHTHLPWLAHQGSWPVGEEWLYQAWSTSYLPLVDLLYDLADEGHQDLLTLALTPVLAAQLDDRYCLDQEQTWLGFWSARALGLASDRSAQARDVAAREHLASQQALASFDRRWSRGASAALRPLADNRVIELLGGPATHPFMPLLDERMAAFALGVGLDDSRSRLGHKPAGIWAPECGYRPGIEEIYSTAGVTHFLVDGPAVRHVGASTESAHTVGDSPVVAFARDLDISYRVWSPRKGYPGGAWYRDFGSIDNQNGFRRWRVTNTASNDKAPYDPDRAALAAEADARDFVEHVREHLIKIRDQREGKPGLVVAAYDTELFGHWWHEGPIWLGHVLRLLPQAGVTVSTLQSAIDAGHVEGRVDLEESSWGSGKDWRVWNGPAVADLVTDNQILQARALDVVDKLFDPRPVARNQSMDQVLRNTLLALSSDWAFMVSKDYAAHYAHDRHREHHRNAHQLLDLIESGRVGAALGLAQRHRQDAGPFAHLDARALAR